MGLKESNQTNKQELVGITTNCQPSFVPVCSTTQQTVSHISNPMEEHQTVSHLLLPVGGHNKLLAISQTSHIVGSTTNCRTYLIPVDSTINCQPYLIPVGSITVGNISSQLAAQQSAISHTCRQHNKVSAISHTCC